MRKVPEWKGKTDDTKIPPRVLLRTFLRWNGNCYRCFRTIAPGDRWQCDHIIPICNGGSNAESNLAPICNWCHRAKTAEDVALKALTYRKRRAHYGLRKPKRPMPGSKASGLKKKFDGTVVKR